MRLDTLFKAVEYTVLRNSGVNISPQQVGLELPTTTSSGFASFLTQKAGAAILPTPPKPPGDPSGYSDINQYYRDLVAYQQQFQVYQSQLFQGVLSRMEQIQQATLQAQRQQANQSKSNTSDSLLGVGGIIDTGISASDLGA